MSSRAGLRCASSLAITASGVWLYARPTLTLGLVHQHVALVASTYACELACCGLDGAHTAHHLAVLASMAVGLGLSDSIELATFQNIAILHWVHLTNVLSELRKRDPARWDDAYKFGYVVIKATCAALYTLRRYDAALDGREENAATQRVNATLLLVFGVQLYFVARILRTRSWRFAAACLATVAGGVRVLR